MKKQILLVVFLLSCVSLSAVPVVKKNKELFSKKADSLYKREQKLEQAAEGYEIRCKARFEAQCVARKQLLDQKLQELRNGYVVATTQGQD